MRDLSAGASRILVREDEKVSAPVTGLELRFDACESLARRRARVGDDGA